MVHLRVQAVIFLELHNKVTKSSSKDCKGERVQDALENALKTRLKGANRCKIWPIKTESNSELFSAPGNAQESANGTTINAFEVHLIIQFKGHLRIHLELHLKVHFKINKELHKKVHLRLH